MNPKQRKCFKEYVRKHLKEYVRKSSKLYVIDKNQIYINKYENLKYTYCLKSTLNERYEEISNDVLAKIFNTKSRIMSYLNSERIFAGSVITLDKNKENYESYCN